ncbi:MAG TPA: hotdog domain-containing protein [Planctomycetota bacterium]|nr:hotdog domain-containing protein [Planctomycetota bacterium]
METFVNVLTAPLSADELMRLLPHRPPFFFLKRLREWTLGVRALADVEFDGSEEFLRGHFPGHPIVPGVILVEACAQAAGLALASRSDSIPTAQRPPSLAKIITMKFRAPVRPRELLEVEAIVTTRFENSGAVEVTMRRGGVTVAEGALAIHLGIGAASA